MAKSSFLSCEKDLELIIKKLFVDSGADSEYLKKLLIITAKDCLDPGNTTYNNVINSYSIGRIMEEGYVTFSPKIKNFEHEVLKSYIIVQFNSFQANMTNDYYRDNVITFDIVCPTDQWDIGDYRVRPLKIAGYIDNILNNKKLTGIGVTNFLSCNQLVYDENFAGYSLSYSVIHGNDDRIK